MKNSKFSEVDSMLLAINSTKKKSKRESGAYFGVEPKTDSASIELLSVDDEEVEEDSEVKNLSLFGLIVFSFFWACGGAYGTEDLVGSAPPLFVFLNLIIVPIIFSLPNALCTMELASAIPRDGGIVVWTEMAVGGLLGAHNYYWLWVVSVFDAAIYPVLLVKYLVSSFDSITEFEGYVIGWVFLIVMLIIKLMGTAWLEKVTTFLAVVTLLPFGIFFLWNIPTLDPSIWIKTEGPWNGVVYLSYSLWLYSGFPSLGTLAGELDNPKKKLGIAYAVVLPLLTAVHVFPFAAALSIDPNPGNYVAGYFTTLAVESVGKWLGYLFLFGSVLSLLGLYNGQSMSAERISYSFIEGRFPNLLPDKETLHKRFFLVRFLWDPSDTGVPRFFIIANSILCLPLVVVPYRILIEFDMLLYSFCLMLFIYAFIYLRIASPSLKRPYKVCGGIVGAIIINIPTAAIVVANMVMSVITDPFSITCALIVILIGVVAHICYFILSLIWQYCCCCCHTAIENKRKSKYFTNKRASTMVREVSLMDGGDDDYL